MAVINMQNYECFLFIHNDIWFTRSTIYKNIFISVETFLTFYFISFMMTSVLGPVLIYIYMCVCVYVCVCVCVCMDSIKD